MVHRWPCMFLLVSHLFISGVTSRNFTIENKCDYTVWPGTFSSGGSSLSTTGFILKKGEASVIDAPPSWQGRIWGRSFCSTNSTGNLSCITGDCGSGKIECSGAVSNSPTTLAKFSLDMSVQHHFDIQFPKRIKKDYYNVSVMDGYNLPLVVVPQGTQNGLICSSVGCVVNLNKTCPSELKVGGEEPVACMSACQAFKSPKFCCTNTTTEKCQPTLYSQNFKKECPLAYSDASSTFTCSNSPSYVLTFCPSTISNTTR